MSWINSRQHAGGQPLPPASTTAATTGPQSGSVGFGGGVGGGATQQHQQQQGWQQQPLHTYSHQTPQYPPPQNNLYSTQSAPNSRIAPQQSWQQQQQQQFPPVNNQYFNKQNPVVDSYVQQNLIAPPVSSNQSTPQHYQQQQPQANNFFQPNLGVNSNISNAPNQQSFMKPELSAVGSMTTTIQQNDNQPAANEGWDDWEWTDNNNQSLQSDQMKQQFQNLQQQQQQQNIQNLSTQDVIADSFATNQVDSWNWSNDDAKNANTIQQSNDVVQNQFISQERQHIADSYGPVSLGVVSTSSLEDSSKIVRPPSVGSAPSGFVQNVLQPPQFSAQQTQQTMQLPQSTGQQLSLPNQQPPAPLQQSPQVSIQQSQPTSLQSNVTPESIANSVANNVYVSQAKPVSQPARQYAMTPSSAGQATPPNAVSSQLDPLPPPPSQTPLGGALPPPPSTNQTPPPPPPVSSSAGNNPYKRAGAAQHHRVALAPTKTQQPAVMQPQFFGPVVGDFQQNASGNQECLAPDNSEVIVDNKAFEVENLEVAPNNEQRNHHQDVAPSNDRNQYLQTDHLSEEGYNNVELAQEQNEQDNFPPPGLSRLVLGQPEIENPQLDSINQNEIPPGLDRMVPGTELVTAGINMERQADGQDTIPAPRSAFSNAAPIPQNNSSSNIDITTDRNLYLVPGEVDTHEQRIVTGLENGAEETATEQREVELDGENIEDQQQQQHQQQHHSHQQQHHPHHHHHQADIEITREEPIEGANTLDSLTSPNANHETESSLTVETNQKDLSNPSTCNDDSDHKGRHGSYYGKSNSRKQDDKRRLPGGNDGKERKERYETESDYYSSDRDRKFREGSVRGDRDRDRPSKERDRRDRREGSARDQDRYRDDKDDRDRRRYDRDRQRGKHDRDRERDRGGRYNNSNRYETDSKYETETSIRYERRRGDRDRDRHDYDYRRDEKDKRHRRNGGERNDRDDRDRRRDNDREYRDRRRGGDRGRGGGGGSSNEYDDDTYSRRTASSRNARETDREYKDRSMRDVKDPRYSSNMYGYPQGYGYDPYSYYQQQQQYYEQLRRTNPQAYAELYRKYYSQVQGDVMGHDGRESVHSGRSSANNEKDRSDQFNASLNLIDGASTTQEPQRSTPCKFTNDHSIASLANGLMVCVKPKYASNGITNVIKVWKFAPNDSTKRLLHSFPGPLVRGITHKKTIIEFCEDQIRLGPPSMLLRSRNNSVSSICSVGQANKASFTLMWTLLILLLRQNGMVVGTDIAELLMKNQTQFPYETNTSNSNAIKSSSASRRNSIQSDQKKSHDNRNSQSNDDDADSMEDKEDDSEESYSKKSPSEEEITEKFRNYLLYGNVNEALEWATDNNLWGHALFLASKVDRRMHANVMMKFANKLSLNDPLQTLYQLMSGRTPSSVTSVQDEKWGDWRPHLAMILSNTSQRPDLDRKAITTLGDSLYNRGDLFGAQFCYLMAQVGFGRYSSVNQDSSFMSNSVNAIRLVLLGSSHHKTFREFATNEAIMMTEIYEYACALNDDKFSIVEFQPYKYLLALRMLDYGMQLKTLMYMEQISRHIQLDPAKYESSFIEKVYNLSDRLKFVDPMLEKSMDDQPNLEINQVEDQPWLQSLRGILHESNAYTAQQVTEVPTISQIDQQFTEINQQFSALSLQYNNFESNAESQQQQDQHSYPGTQPQVVNDPQYQIQYQHQQPNNGVDSAPQSMDQYGQYYNPNQQQMPSLPGQSSATSDYGSYISQSHEQQPSYDQEQYQQYPPAEGQQQGQNYGYWDQQSQQTEPKGQNTVDQPSTTPTPSQLTATTSPPLLETPTRPCSISTSSAPNTNNLTVYNSTNKTSTQFDPAAVTNQKKQNIESHTAPPTVDQTSLEPNRSPYKLTNCDQNKISADSTREDVNNRLKLPPTSPSAPASNNSNIREHAPLPPHVEEVSNSSKNPKTEENLAYRENNEQFSVTNRSIMSKTTHNCNNNVIESSVNVVTKHVNFNLTPLDDTATDDILNNSDISRATGTFRTNHNANSYRASTVKNIVFNGTYPIDYPLKSRFDNNDIDHEAGRPYRARYSDYDDDYDDEDITSEDEDVEDPDEDSHASWTMQELIADKSVHFNYSKMCDEIQHSFEQFERFLTKKNEARPVRTFDIDGPL